MLVLKEVYSPTRYSTQYVYNRFVGFIAEHYSAKVSAEEMEVFKKLLLAMETYCVEYRVGEYTSFKTSMQGVVDAYEGLNPDLKTNFTNTFGSVYSHYEYLLKVLKGETEPTDVDLGAFGADFAELVYVLQKLSSIPTPLEETDYLRFLSAFEYAQLLENHITKNAPQEVLYAYYNNGYIKSGEYYYTVDFLVNYYRSGYHSVLHNTLIPSGSANIPLNELYYNTDMQEFLVSAFPVLWYETPQVMTEGYLNMFTQAMTAFRNLPVDQKVLFIFLDVNGNYYKNITKFANETLNEACKPIVEKLLQLEQMYVGYIAGNKNITLENVTTLYDEVTAMKEALEGVDVTNFESFMGDAYAYYTQAVAKLQQAD